MNFDFSAFDDKSITMRISEGVYYFEDIPIYIVEHVEEDLSEYILVYDVQEGTEEPMKKFTTMSVNTHTIPGGTKLSNIIKSRIPPRIQYKKIISEPIFVSNIIHMGTDTVTGKVGKGFFERARDKEVLSESGRKIIPGDYTGVFIGLSSIEWRKSYTPLDSVVETYRRQKEDRINVWG